MSLPPSNHSMPSNPNPMHGDSLDQAAADLIAGAVGEAGGTEPNQPTQDEPKPDGDKTLEQKPSFDTADKCSTSFRAARD